MSVYEEGIDPIFLFRAAGAMVGTVVLFFIFYLATGSLGDLVLIISAFFLVFLAMLPPIAKMRFKLTNTEVIVESIIYNKAFKLSDIRHAGTNVRWKHLTRRKGLRIELEDNREDLISHAKRKMVHYLSPTKSAIVLMDGSIYSLPVNNSKKFFKELTERINNQ